MCRWLAYTGSPLRLHSLLFEAQNSLINQSLACQRGSVATNGDGFGVGWYGTQDKPGLYRDIRPAWNDDNLRSLAEQIEARLFFAHVRASTGTPTTRQNCHPFRHGNWLFMHNGRIGGYDKVRRDLEFRIAPHLYNDRIGTTDSEIIFLLLLGNGLLTDPAHAYRQTIADIESAMQANGVTEPLRFTACATDGQTLHAIRYSSDNSAPTLFYAQGQEVQVDNGACNFPCGTGAVLILSEPLDRDDACWNEVPEGYFLTASAHQAVLEPVLGVEKISAVA